MADLLLKAAVPDGATCEGCAVERRLYMRLDNKNLAVCMLFKDGGDVVDNTPCSACLAARKAATDVVIEQERLRRITVLVADRRAQVGRIEGGFAPKERALCYADGIKDVLGGLDLILTAKLPTKTGE